MRVLDLIAAEDVDGEILRQHGDDLIDVTDTKEKVSLFKLLLNNNCCVLTMCKTSRKYRYPNTEQE